MIMFWYFVVYLSMIIFFVLCTVSIADYVLVFYCVTVGDYVVFYSDLLLMVIVMFYSVYIGDVFWCFLLIGRPICVTIECQGPLWS